METVPLYKLTMSGKWQSEVQAFVDRKVYYCVSTLIHELAKDEKYLDDLLPVLVSDDWDSAAYDNGRKDDCEESPEGYCRERDIEPYQAEAFEHWIVSDWLANKLEAKGQMIIRDFMGLTIWGRTITGQGISIDGVINEIYYETIKETEAFNRLAKDLGLGI